MTSDAKPFPRETRDPIEDVWGPRTPYHGDWPERVDEHVEEEVGKWVQSACVMCSNGCGADIGVSKDGKRIVGIRGRGVDRVNKGRLGPKGMCSWEYNGHPQRLTSPQVRKNGKLEDVSWDEAMNLIVEQSNKIRKALTPHAIAFYTSGQLFLEEYHALAMVGKGGLGTLTMDGNTRLCTASAAAAMRENFGSDGQPGSYTDVDVTDCLWITGHNVAATQTVLWARMLDRFEGPKPPKCVVIDPRLTPTAELAVKHGIHLKPNNGTNLALLNGIQHVMFEKDWIRWDYVNKNTIGVDELRDTVKGYDPKRVEEITGVPAADIEKAARILWESKTVLATALQGVYQSNQAVASACQINNVQLLMGNIGKPGGGIYQMNGQPTAQNNREAGCNGEYPGFRNNNNPQHMEELAKLWNINVWDLPAWQDPIHIMSMLQMMEAGTIKMLWISGTNPAVSLVNLERVRKILTMPGLYVIAQDIFETETTQLADIVLPAAMWGEKTGCFTNVDRTVHISHKAIEPPGLAKSDLDIFLDYAKRMQFKNKDGEDLLPFHDSESAFDHWRSTTGGRVCDYTGMSYANLSEGSGIQWPCNAKAPKGTERLYTDANFMTRENDAESFGHDLETGTPIDPKTYAKMNPNGRAILKKCNYRAPVDGVNKDYPLGLLTGRNHLHFHTRTKTGRSARLNKADPDPYVQIHPEDAEPLGIKTGDYVKVESIHGVIEVPAKLGKIDKGQIFVPFHFGTVVDNNGQGRAGTANELTQPTWDYTSKQPTFKTGGVRISKVTEKGPVVETKQKVAVRSLEDPVYAQDQKKEDDFSDRIRHIEDYLGLWDDCTKQLLIQLDELIDTLKGDFEIASGMMIVKDFVHQAKEKLKPFSEKYGSNYQAAERDVKAIHDALFPDYRKGHGSLELLMDLQGLLTMIGYTNGFLTALLPVSQGLHDKDFAAAVKDADLMMIRSLEWCRGQIKVKAAHTLIVPAPPSAGRLAPDQ